MERKAIVDWIVKELAQRGDCIGVPEAFAGHRTFMLAYRRGVLMGMNAELDSLPAWYTGEDLKAVYQRGWLVGRTRLAREAVQADAVITVEKHKQPGPACRS